MGRGAHSAVGRRWGVGVAVAGVADASAASFSHPFTVTADVVTAVPLVGALALMAWTLSRRRADGTPSARGPTGSDRWSRWWLVWVAGGSAVAAWELFCYANLPRRDHPTASVLIDLLDSSRVGKAVAFASWLALGWFLAAR